MRKILLFILCFLLCEGRIKVDIITASDADHAKVSVSGADEKLITDKEIGLYNFTKENLNRGIRIELGKAPDDIFWHDPTTYGDLFKKFKWPQVRRNVMVAKAKIINIANENADLKVVNYINDNYNKTIEFNIREFAMLENTVSSTWSKAGLLNDTIHFDVDINFNNKKKFHFEDTWGNNSFIYIDLPFGVAEINATLKVKPGQTVVYKLTGQRTTIRVEIEYLAKLVGNLVLDYENLYGKYHFYSPTVNNIMRAANMTNDIRTTQWIEIKCHTEPRLSLTDSISGKSVTSNERSHFIQVDRKQTNTGKKRGLVPKVAVLFPH